MQDIDRLQGSISLVEGFSRWLSEAMHECKADLLDLLALCTACNRALLRVTAHFSHPFLCAPKFFFRLQSSSFQERDKQYLTKAVVSELVQALRFKCDMNEHNYMTVVELILQDAGENVSEEIVDDQVPLFS